MGFIFLLNNLSIEELQTYAEIWDDFPSVVGPGDRRLYGFLGVLAKDGMKQDVIFNHYRDSESEPSELPQIFDGVSSKSPAPIFSKETTLEFHKLTVAAFNGFAYTFMQLKAEMKLMVGIDY